MKQEGRARRAGLALAAAAMLAGRAGAPARAQQVQVSRENRTISITATANAERRADVAALHIGYHIYAPDSAHAYAEAARLSQAIASALERTGVPQDAIASNSQSTQESPEYRSSNTPAEERAQRRFEAEQSWTVKTTPEAVAKILAAAVSVGANQSGEIDWSLADESTLAAEAGTKALSQAKRIATEMAEGLGAKVGSLIYASNEVEALRPKAVFRGGRSAARLSGEAAPAPTLQLSAPMITRSATVSAIFAIE